MNEVNFMQLLLNFLLLLFVYGFLITFGVLQLRI